MADPIPVWPEAVSDAQLAALQAKQDAGAAKADADKAAEYAAIAAAAALHAAAVAGGGGGGGTGSSGGVQSVNGILPDEVGNVDTQVVVISKAAYDLIAVKDPRVTYYVSN